jgi:hypothetical protein
MSDDLPSDSLDALEQHRHSPLDLLLNVMSGGGQYAPDDQTLGGLLDPILAEGDIEDDDLEDDVGLRLMILQRSVLMLLYRRSPNDRMYPTRSRQDRRK